MIFILTILIFLLLLAIILKLSECISLICLLLTFLILYVGMFCRIFSIWNAWGIYIVVGLIIAFN